MAGNGLTSKLISKVTSWTKRIIAVAGFFVAVIAIMMILLMEAKGNSSEEMPQNPAAEIIPSLDYNNENESVKSVQFNSAEEVESITEDLLLEFYTQDF